MIKILGHHTNKTEPGPVGVELQALQILEYPRVLSGSVVVHKSSSWARSFG